LRSLGRLILDDTISDEELRARLFAEVSREELVACVEKIGEWVTGKRSDLFHGIIRRHGMLRKFSPALLDALELSQGFALFFFSLARSRLVIAAVSNGAAGNHADSLFTTYCGNI
jgi:hypothetical protein